MSAGIAFADLAPEAPTLSFASPPSSGSKRERTPQGYLIIRDVVMARTGVQIYGPHEVPIEPGPVGYIEISREADDLFAPETLRSFENIPVTNDHPRVDGVLTGVNPDNYSTFARGAAFNVRQGEGEQVNLLLADVILYSREAIEAVESGKSQVSAGYDAVYFRLEPGRGKQAGIVGNHLAIVASGRCGSLCAFGDEDTMNTATPATPGATPGTVPTLPGLRPAPIRPRAMPRAGTPGHRAAVLAGRLRAALMTGDDDMFNAEIDSMLEDPAPEAVDPLDEIRSAVAALQTAMAGIVERMDAAAAAPAQAAEAATAVAAVAEEIAAVAEAAGADLGDELVTDAAWRDVISRAEILKPGLAIPTGDAIATPVSRRAAIVGHQRAALSAAYDAAPETIGPLFGTATKPDFTKMPGMVLRGFFMAAAAAMASKNTKTALPAGFTADASGTAPATAGMFGLPQPVPGLALAPSKIPSASDINNRAKDVWAARAPAAK